MKTPDKDLWRARIAAALEGQCDHSRDCRLTGDYLASMVWPIIEAAIATAETSAIDLAALRAGGEMHADAILSLKLSI